MPDEWMRRVRHMRSKYIISKPVSPAFTFLCGVRQRSNWKQRPGDEGNPTPTLESKRNFDRDGCLLPKKKCETFSIPKSEKYAKQMRHVACVKGSCPCFFRLDAQIADADDVRPKPRGNSTRGGAFPPCEKISCGATESNPNPKRLLH